MQLRFPVKKGKKAYESRSLEFSGKNLSGSNLFFAIEI